MVKLSAEPSSYSSERWGAAAGPPPPAAGPLASLSAGPAFDCALGCLSFPAGGLEAEGGAGPPTAAERGSPTPPTPTPPTPPTPAASAPAASPARLIPAGPPPCCRTTGSARACGGRSLLLDWPPVDADADDTSAGMRDAAGIPVSPDVAAGPASPPAAVVLPPTARFCCSLSCWSSLSCWYLSLVSSSSRCLCRMSCCCLCLCS